MQKGKFIVFDGNDGSGKQTQARLLIERLEKEGHKIRIIDFPRYYNNFFGKFIGECLTGKYGDFIGVDPHIISVIYAADRYESSAEITEWLDKGYIVLADRYVSANQIHNGGKIKDVIKRRQFLEWLDQMEYGAFKLPKPDLVVYLDVPVSISLENLKNKKEEYLKAEDQHETNVEFLQNSRECGLWLCDQSGSWQAVACAPENNKMRSIEDIHDDIYNVVKKVV